MNPAYASRGNSTPIVLKNQAGLQSHMLELLNKSKEFQETINEMNTAQNNIKWNAKILNGKNSIA